MELTGVEAILVPALKLIMLGVMIVGGVAVFRELIPMARGRVPTAPAQTQEEQE